MPSEPPEDDWDLQIETPPPRHSEQVVVKFIPGAYRKPKIVEDPTC